MSMLHWRLVAVLFLFCVEETHTANWAQTSGEIEQNVVLPAMPSPTLSHWQARFGHATVIAADVRDMYALLCWKMCLLLLLCP